MTPNRQSPASDDEASGSFGAWTLVWTLVTMKIVTIVIVILAARQAEAGTLFALITWHWLVVLGALLAAPVIFRYRLRRVRARRDSLVRAEWMVEDDVQPECRFGRAVRECPAGMGRFDDLGPVSAIGLGGQSTRTSPAVRTVGPWITRRQPDQACPPARSE